MKFIKEIEDAVAHLSEDKLREFRAWFNSFDAQRWDEQFEADVADGRLDALADEAIKDLEEGRTREL